jgi:hypothetical protein
MRKSATVIGIMAVLGLTGCATKGYVVSQTDPLTERLSNLENRVKSLEATVALPARLSDSDSAALKQAGDNARQALDTANRASAEAAGANANASKVSDAAARSEGAAARSESAAVRAEESAKSAQQAEQKSEKIFRLHQKK